MKVNDPRRWLWPRNIAILVAGLLTLSGGLRNDQSVPHVHSGAGYTYEASRSVGELALSIAARTSRIEDAWIYVGGTWTDVGVHEEVKSVQVDSAAFMAALLRWSERASGYVRSESATPVFYHIHPFSRTAWAVEPPSAADIYALALLKQECKALTGANLVGAVIDGRGKWVFDLSSELEARLTNRLGSAAVEHGGSTDFAALHGYAPLVRGAAAFDLKYPPLSWAAFLPGGPKSRQRRIAEFVDGARQLGVLVTYHSF